MSAVRDPNSRPKGAQMLINPISHKPRQRVWSAGLLAGCRVGLPARAEINHRQRKADESAPQVQPARLHPWRKTPPPLPNLRVSTKFLRDFADSNSDQISPRRTPPIRILTADAARCAACRRKNVTEKAPFSCEPLLSP